MRSYDSYHMTISYDEYHFCKYDFTIDQIKYFRKYSNMC